MPFHFEYTLTEFTPGEAEKITGVSTAMQRDWRRREFLPSNKGHARFDLFDLAEMMFLQAMSDRGIGPQRSKPLAAITGRGIAFGALMCQAAYEGDLAPGSDMTRAIDAIGKTARDKDAARVISGRYLIVWADGKETWHVNVQKAIDDLPEKQKWKKLTGPVLVLDQWAMGAALVQRAGRPLIHSERIDA